jgi:hypothetical protein
VCHGRSDATRVQPLRAPATYGYRPMDEFELAFLMDPTAPDVDELIAGLLNRPAWHRKTACRGMGPDMFFTAAGEPTVPSTRASRQCVA